MGDEGYFEFFEGLKNHSKNFDAFDMISDNEVIFEYRLSNAGDYCIGEDEDGFSITIYRNGYLLYREYETENIEVKFKKFTLPINTVKQIYTLSKESNIKEVPERLDNDSDDGDFNEFVFYDNKKISALNIIDEEYKPETLDKDYLKNYGENYYHECQVIKLFNAIANELLRAGYRLGLYSFRKKLFTRKG